MLSLLTAFLLLCLGIIAYKSINSINPIDPCYSVKFRHHPACESAIKERPVHNTDENNSLQKICANFLPKPVNTTDELFYCHSAYNESSFKNDINDDVFKKAYYEFYLLSSVNNVHNNNDRLPKATFNYMYRRILDNNLENSVSLSEDVIENNNKNKGIEYIRVRRLN